MTDLAHWQSKEKSVIFVRNGKFVINLLKDEWKQEILDNQEWKFAMHINGSAVVDSIGSR